MKQLLTFWAAPCCLVYLPPLHDRPKLVICPWKSGALLSVEIPNWIYQKACDAQNATLLTLPLSQIQLPFWEKIVCDYDGDGGDDDEDGDDDDSDGDDDHN